MADYDDQYGNDERHEQNGRESPAPGLGVDNIGWGFGRHSRSIATFIHL